MKRLETMSITWDKNNKMFWMRAISSVVWFQGEAGSGILSPPAASHEFLSHAEIEVTMYIIYVGTCHLILVPFENLIALPRDAVHLRQLPPNLG